jgi:hydroxypyruvate reductase
VTVATDPLVSSSGAAGAHVARELIRRAEQESDPLACHIWGGETTVKLDPQRPGQGGRCLELALAAAREFGRDSDAAVSLHLLAAGTDGRDGPTDAAGAIVDSATWGVIETSGRHPERDLVRHDSYPALDAAGALLRTGPTGTNVNDVVIGLVPGRAYEDGD